MRADNPKITEQFASDKRKLAEVTAEQWEAIPEIGDYTIKKRQRTTYAPAPDSLLAAAANAGAMANSVGGSGAGGMVTPGTASTVNDLTAMGEWSRGVLADYCSLGVECVGAGVGA
jgi:pre-mRNA-processing factor 6